MITELLFQSFTNTHIISPKLVAKACILLQGKLQLKDLPVAVKAHPALAVLAAEMSNLVDHACR